MADDRSKSPKGSWRKAVPSSSPTPAPTSSHAWTARKARPAAPPGRPRAWIYKATTAGLALLGCLIFLVVLVVVLRRPDPVGVVLVGADYAGNLAVPHNVAGWRGLLDLDQFLNTARRRTWLRVASVERIRKVSRLENKSQWEALVGDLKTAGFSHKTLVVVLALHGGTDPEGGFLMPDQYQEPADGLRLARVIESLGTLPRDKTKILVLEGTQVAADWRIGMCTNDFGRSLRDLEPAIRKIPNLWVLSAADVDQRSWASEGLGRTAFSHYLLQALAGGMDSAGRQPSLDDLFKYVRRHVTNWAWATRGAVQEPVLLPATGDRGEADRPASRDVLLATVAGAKPPGPAPRFDRGDVAAAWQRFHELDRLSPHPSAYSPMRWREYRSRLVRYEELQRASADDAAIARMRDRLVVLGRVLKDERFLKTLSGSIENLLAMNAVAGGRVDEAAGASKAVGPLWTAESRTEVETRWEALRSAPQATDGELPRSPRSLADEFLVRAAQESPETSLSRAAARLGDIRGEDYPQPAEAHFLRMLDRSLTPDDVRRRSPRFWNVAARALATRRTADRAALGVTDPAVLYAYPEQIEPWTRALVATADEARRLGEDRLFSSEPDSWEQAGKSLTLADEGFGKAARLAETVRNAVAVRDRVASGLPEYARWVPGRRSVEAEDDLPAAVETLSARAHELSQALEAARPDTEARLGGIAREVAQAFDAVVVRFASQKSNAEGPQTPEDWAVYSTSARVAFPDTDDLALRTAFWNRLDNVREHDVEETVKSVSHEPVSEEVRKDLARQRLFRARLELRMAVASLGRVGYEDTAGSPGSGAGDFDAHEAKTRLALPGDASEVPAWTKGMVAAGFSVGNHWRRQSRLVEELAGEKVTIPDDLQAYRDRLVKADRVARRVDPGSPPLAEPAAEPSGRFRQLRVHELLLVLAERTWRDHWYAEEARSKPPYYKEAGARFVDDAARVFREGAQVRDARERIARPGELKLQGPPALLVTSERNLSVALRIETSGAVPPGVPVYRSRPPGFLRVNGQGEGYRAAEPEAGGESIRLSLSHNDQAGAGKPARTVPSVERSPLLVEGIYRGQPFSSSSAVEVHTLPEVVGAGPEPPEPRQATLSVRASEEVIRRFGQGTGAIAIVLDCSASMIPEAATLAQANAYPDTKFQQAKKALASVLELVPSGTTVSVWVFSQAREGVIAYSQHTQEDYLLGQEPERTIRQLIPPTSWKPEEREKLVARMDRLWPWFSTPLVQAMWSAKDDLKGAKGLKTLLVLTDGDDTRFEKNTRFNTGNLKIPEFLAKYFANTSIAINMVFFRLEPKDLARAKANFGVIETMSPPGQIFTAENFGGLVESLRRSVKQKLVCEVLRQGKSVGEVPLDVTEPGQPDLWWPEGLEPGRYTLRVRADRAYTQDVELAAGDRLALKLVEGESGGLAFQRALYSDDLRGAIRREGGGSRASVLASATKDEKGGDLKVLAALESLEVAAPVLRQPRPRFVWFGLTAKGASGDPDFAVRWRERAFYPSPVWQLEVPQWPADPTAPGLAGSVLNVTWVDAGQDLTPDGVFELDAATPEAVENRPISITGGRSVVVESIRLEDHALEARPGRAPGTEHCLVVRVDYGKGGGPVLIDPESLRRGGIELLGYEHKFYSRARKYAGLFYPVTREQAARIKSLNLISLPRLRDEAAKRSQSLAIDFVPSAEAGGRIPPPPDLILSHD